MEKATWRQEFALTDSMRIYDFPDELVSYRVEFPPRKVRAENLVLVALHRGGQDGREPAEPVAFQLSGVAAKDGFMERATVSF